MPIGNPFNGTSMYYGERNKPWDHSDLGRERDRERERDKEIEGERGIVKETE